MTGMRWLGLDFLRFMDEMIICCYFGLYIVRASGELVVI